jgi:phage tail-like protein
MKMMNNVGVTAKSLHQKWQFGVEIDGFDVAYFTKAALPDFEFDEVAFSPGGAIFDQKAAGRVKFNDVTLEMGTPQNDTQGEDFIDWFQQCVDVAQNAGAVPDDYMKDIDIVEYDRSGTEIRRWTLNGSFVKSGKLGDLEGGSSENTIRSCVIAYQYFTPPTKR